MVKIHSLYLAFLYSSHLETELDYGMQLQSFMICSVAVQLPFLLLIFNEVIEII